MLQLQGFFATLFLYRTQVNLVKMALMGHFYFGPGLAPLRPADTSPLSISAWGLSL